MKIHRLSWYKDHLRLVMEEIINVTKSLSLGELKIINQKLHNKLKEEK